MISSVSLSLEHGTPTISVQMEGVSRCLILDTGSNVSILQPGVSSGDVRVTAQKPHGVTGDLLDIGLQSASFSLNGREYTHAFLLCPLPTEAAGLLGTDFFEKTGAIIDFECATMSFADVGKVPRAYSVPHAKHSALTVFTGGKVESSPQLRIQEMQHADQHPQLISALR